MKRGVCRCRGADAVRGQTQEVDVGPLMLSGSWARVRTVKIKWKWCESLTAAHTLNEHHQWAPPHGHGPTGRTFLLLWKSLYCVGNRSSRNFEVCEKFLLPCSKCIVIDLVWSFPPPSQQVVHSKGSIEVHVPFFQILLPKQLYLIPNLHCKLSI
jgi:hypothetical protein